MEPPRPRHSRVAGELPEQLGQLVYHLLIPQRVCYPEAQLGKELRHDVIHDTSVG